MRRLLQVLRFVFWVFICVSAGLSYTVLFPEALEALLVPFFRP
jgi:hypothetical protein